jgi:hypothetical protein
MFVALELLGDPPYDGMLFAHEAVHLAHIHHGAANWPDDVASHLIQEGVATAASRELHLAQSDSGYLWNDDQHDSWVRQCREAERALITIVLEEMTTPAVRLLAGRSPGATLANSIQPSRRAPLESCGGHR